MTRSDMGRDARRRTFRSELDELRRADLDRELPCQTAHGIDFVSNDYLGLTRHEAVRAAARSALAEHGAGAGGPPPPRAAEPAHALEREVADWLGAPAALLFPSGYQANLGLATSICGPDDVVLSDALIHASSIDACRLSRARTEICRHADLADFEARLRQHAGARRRIVLTEGVFSMDGDVPPLAELHALCRAHDAWLVIDEAHSTGLLGPEGNGAWAALETNSDEALVARIVTCGKALGATGALIVGDTELCELLVNQARSFVFSTSAPPAMIAAARAAITLCRSDDWRRKRALALAQRLAAGLDLPRPDAAIVPLPIGDAGAAIEKARKLRELGFRVGAVRPPTVPRGASGLRLVCHAHNDEDQVDRLVDAIRGRTRQAPARVTPAAGTAHERNLIFVAGTDTGIGKTVVAAALLRALREQAGDVRYWKPVQTGDDDDTTTVARLADIDGDAIAPPGHRLPLPASPHEAARDAGTRISMDALRATLRERCHSAPDARWIVEFAGGLMVPYGDGNLQIDWIDDAAALGAQVVLVARTTLGTLNHTLLSLAALRARGVRPTALVLVGDAHEANRATLTELAADVAVLHLPLLETLNHETLDAWNTQARWPLDQLAATNTRRRETALKQRDRACLWHPYTQHGLDDDPLPVVAARGSWLTLADGSRLLDGISSWWTNLHGHGRAEITAAITEQAARLDHVLFAGATHAPAVELAERLVALAPRGLQRVFFSDDGSTAVEVALKIARQAFVNLGEPQRTTFIAFEGSYHGDTFGAMAVADPDPFFASFEPMLFDVRRVALDPDALETALDDLGDIAAGVIVEPIVQGAAGMRMHGPGFLAAIRSACDRHRLPMIADEVMTGFGRTGALFACEHAGVTPDLLCLAKGLTGGTLPLAATLATGRLFEAFLDDAKARMFFHGHSFTANPIGCAAALASLDLIERENTVSRLDRLGIEIEASLRADLPDAEALSLRRCGSIVAFDLPGERSYLADTAGRARQIAREHDCLLRPLGSVIYAMPPASTTAAEARQLATAMAAIAEQTGYRP